MNSLTVKDISPDRCLSIAIAVTFGIAVSHLHNSPALNSSLIKPLQWKRYSYEELMDNYNSVWKITNYDADTHKASHATTAAKYAASAPRFAYGNHAAKYASYTANHATRAVDKTDFIHNNLKLLLPLILNYKINKSNRPFNSPEKILKLLGDEDRQQFLFNLDVLQ